VGGTDPGRFVPALLNGSEGDPRIVITQNGLADAKYLEYVQFLYGDRFAALAPEDARAAQLEYLQDARKRLEQNQLRPGEDVRLKAGELQSGFEDDAVQASGQISVMAVNELLLNKLLEKNPNLSFALEESFPLKSVNTDATPNGPIMELRAQEDNPFTPERAAQSVEYWREQTKQLMADAEFMESEYAKKSYSKLVSTQAGLLADRNYPTEAEAAFQFANQLCPYCPEAVLRHVDLLLSQQRVDDASHVLNNAIGADPKNQQFRDLAAQLQK
jgi:predicted Zn-dependent protease